MKKGDILFHGYGGNLYFSIWCGGKNVVEELSSKYTLGYDEFLER